MMKYTIDQTKAIESYGKNIIVSAGAGSGKTQVLTERVIHFVKNYDFKLSNFLILTFTNLAADEMKVRIRKALEKEHLKESENVDVADISTFDAYALSLVKKYHFMLNVSPNVAIVDSNIISVRKRTILDEIFDDLYNNHDQEFLDIIAKYCFKDDKSIKELIIKFILKADLEIDKEAYLDNFITNFYSEEMISSYFEQVLKEIKKMKNELLDLVEELTEEPLSKSDDTPYKDAVKSTIIEFIKAEDYESLIKLFPNKHAKRLPSKLSLEEKLVNNEVKERWTNLYDFLSGLPKNKKEFYDYFLNIIPTSQKLIEIVRILDQKVVSFKKANQVYEFQDIAKKALYLVKNHDDIRSDIKNKLKMIMIDEYQDTSSLQEAFISYIANNNVYMVGDVKQSIYRFRNARCEIFINKYQEYKNGHGGMAIDLNKNFRSRQEVLSDINFIFKDLLTLNHGGANYIKEHMIEYGNKKYLDAGDKKASSHAEFLIYPEVNADESMVFEANLVARDIISKINSGYLVLDTSKEEPSLRPCCFSDFCILMDRGSAFDKYLEVFTEYQIPLFIENDEDITENDMVLMLKNLLKLIKSVMTNDYVSPDFVKAFLSVARSFVLEYSDNKLYLICKNKTFKEDELILTLKKIVKENNDLPVSALFVKVIFELDIYHKCILIGNVEKNSKYLDVFIEMFKNMSSLDYSLDDFIIYLDNINSYGLKINLSSTSSAVNSVRLMNIHKSKGLEFNIVYLAGLYKTFNRQDLRGKFNVTDFGLVLPNEEDESKIIIPQELNKLKEISEDLSEKIRMFYVALTRAREKIIFLYRTKDCEEYSLEEKSKINDLELEENEKPVITFLEEPLEDDIKKISAATSFYDFITPFYKTIRFKKYTYNLLEKSEELMIHSEPIVKEKLDVKNVFVKSNLEVVKRASKKLNLSSSKENLKFGIKIHKVLEVIDFKNPNYDIIIDQNIKKIVKRFLSSKLLENIKDGNIYKEYEFYDDKTLKRGILDLMVIYDDHIDIIDYKTKNIDDDSYTKQLKVYEEFANLTFKKDVNTYLYSLITGEVKKTN